MPCLRLAHAQLQQHTFPTDPLGTRDRRDCGRRGADDPDPPPSTRAAYRWAIHEILKRDLVPPGFRLHYKGRDRGDLLLSIVPIDEVPGPEIPPLAISIPIPTPTTFRGCHPLIRENRQFIGRKKTGWVETYHQKGVAHLRVQAPNVERSLLVLQARINEAELRGLTVPMGSRCEGLVLVDGPSAHEIAIKEEARRKPHEPTPWEQQRIARGEGCGILKYDLEPTGRLRFPRESGHPTCRLDEAAGRMSPWQSQEGSSPSSTRPRRPIE